MPFGVRNLGSPGVERGSLRPWRVIVGTKRNLSRFMRLDLTHQRGQIALRSTDS